MIKGGFQGLDISGVDLTAQSPSLPGAYAACAAADGKPIRVLTADGAVQCSVKKVSTNYVLAGVTGDGKILSIAVGTTDGIEVIETTPASEPSGNLLIGNAVDISGATTSEPFTVPNDGYVRIVIMNSDTATASNAIEAVIKAKAGGVLTIARVFGPPAEGQTLNEDCVFVKKGTKLYIYRSLLFTGGHGYFRPLINE